MVTIVTVTVLGAQSACVLNVRLTPAIHRQIAMLALQAGLSINAYIKDALEEKVESAVAI